jgi:hypothetical protein
MRVIEIAEHPGARANDGMLMEFDEFPECLLVPMSHPAHEVNAARVNVFGIVGSGRRVLGHGDH